MFLYFFIYIFYTFFSDDKIQIISVKICEYNSKHFFKLLMQRIMNLLFTLNPKFQFLLALQHNCENHLNLV